MIRLKQWYRLIKLVQQRYIADGCSNSAAALTYMSLFAVVPLMTVMYAMLSAVPAFQEVGMQIEGFVFEHFIPSTGQEVQKYLQQFSEQARNLTGIGVVFLGITALMMLKNIEKIFNSIWHIQENRKGLSSFLLYWAILSLGPLFVGLALAISTYLVSLKVVFDQVDVIGIGPHLLRLTPYLLTSAAFTLLFAAVPNCRVPLKHAVTGGFITALAFEIAKQLFTFIVANTSFQPIYGTFAAIPLFLLWIYLSWLIVLAGAELVHALQGLPARFQQLHDQLTLAIAVLELLWRRHQQATPIRERQLLSEHWLFDQHPINAEQWTAIKAKLLDANLLTVTQAGDYVLGKDLNHVTLWDLTQLLHSYGTTSVNDQDLLPQWYTLCQQRLQQANTYSQQQLSVPLAQLFLQPEQQANAQHLRSTNLSNNGTSTC